MVSNMENLVAKAAYLKGLADGMKIDLSSDTNKLIMSIIEVVDGIAREVDMVSRENEYIADSVDSINEEISFIANEVLGKNHRPHGGDDGSESEFQIACPNCNEVIDVDIDELDGDEIICPHCNEEIEFDFDCDCDCEDCEDC